MRTHGAVRLYAKRLAPNDNSKNQVYLGGDFSALNVIPYTNVHTDSSTSAGSVRNRAKANVSMFWVDAEGKHQAPNAQLILYPKYPEVRMSGFLQNCTAAPSDVMNSRDEGRVLFFGITTTGELLCYASGTGQHLSNYMHENNAFNQIGIFLEIPMAKAGADDNREYLLAKLTEIHDKGWIPSQKLSRNGGTLPYSAPNGGGYTLEAELGISPNGFAEPDYLGWEIKQYGVNNFEEYIPRSPVTLMTPEPTGGIYKSKGISEFMYKYGYPDKRGVLDRINFGGIYSCSSGYHDTTKVKMELCGYDSAKKKIIDIAGGIVLKDQKGEEAATWAYTSMMEHWNKKHALAAYVPSMRHYKPSIEYSYGEQVLLCSGTDFLLFLKAMSNSTIYYDPGIKMENISSRKPKFKKRSQFRIKHSDLTSIYHCHEYVILA